MNFLARTYERFAAGFEPAKTVNETIHNVLFSLAKAHLNALAHLVGKNYTVQLVSEQEQQRAVQFPEIIQAALEEVVANPFTSLICYLIGIAVSLYLTLRMMETLAVRESLTLRASCHRRWARIHKVVDSDTELVEGEEEYDMETESDNEPVGLEKKMILRDRRQLLQSRRDIMEAQKAMEGEEEGELSGFHQPSFRTPDSTPVMYDIDIESSSEANSNGDFEVVYQDTSA